MARTLQTLRRDVEPSRLQTAAPPEAPLVPAPVEEEIPFIEVGGKDTPIGLQPA